MFSVAPKVENQDSAHGSWIHNCCASGRCRSGFSSPQLSSHQIQRIQPQKEKIHQFYTFVGFCWMIEDDFYTFVGWLLDDWRWLKIEHGCWMIQLWPAVESQVATASAIWNPCESSMSSKSQFTVDPWVFNPSQVDRCWGSNHHLRNRNSEIMRNRSKLVLHGLHQRLPVDTLRHLKATCIMPSKTQKNLRTCHPLPSTARHRPAIAALSSILATTKV